MAKKPKKTVTRSKGKPSFSWKALAAGLFTVTKLRIYLRTAQTITLVAVVAAVIYGFRLMEDYVLTTARQQPVDLEVVLKDRHERWDWVSNELVRDILLAADVKSDDFLLDNDLTRQWAANLRQHSWIKDINLVHKRYDGKVIIDCEIRRPIAKVKEGSKVYYIDPEGCVMAPVYGEMGGEMVQVNPVLDHLVEIKGAMKNLPEPGKGHVADDVKSGLKVIEMIRLVDAQQPDRNMRVLKELAVCDVSNYKDRKDRALPRIVFFTPRNTEIRWGAEVGSEISEFEPAAPLKLSRLYQTYSKYQTLDTYMHVELRNHRNDKSDPLRTGS